MENRRTEKQMLDFHRAICENLFSMMTVLQGQAENIFSFFCHYTDMSDEMKEIMDRRIGEYKKGLDDLKNAMDEGYAKVEDYYHNHSVAVFHDRTSKNFRTYVNQAKGMPPDLKKTMDELIAKYKTGCEEFRKYIDKKFWHMEDYLHPADSLKIKNKKMRIPSVHRNTASNP